MPIYKYTDSEALWLFSEYFVKQENKDLYQKKWRTVEP